MNSQCEHEENQVLHASVHFLVHFKRTKFGSQRDFPVFWSANCLNMEVLCCRSQAKVRFEDDILCSRNIVQACCDIATLVKFNSLCIGDPLEKLNNHKVGRFIP